MMEELEAEAEFKTVSGMTYVATLPGEGEITALWHSDGQWYARQGEETYTFTLEGVVEKTTFVHPLLRPPYVKE